MPPTSNRDQFPLSVRQQRLWFIEQLEAGGLSSNLVQAFKLEGTLSIEILQRALDGTVARHASLRTTFATVEAEPAQVIAKEKSASPRVKLLASQPERKLEDEVVRLGNEEMERPFDLTQGPLVRVTVAPLNEQQHILVIAFHLIISDPQSIRIFLRELLTSYEALSVGQPYSPTELPIQYVDCAVREGQWLQTEDAQRQLEYWKQRLQGAAGLLELPTDKPRPPVQTYRGARHLKTIPKSLCDSLVTFSQREGVSLFTTLLAAFQVLLSRYTGEEDILVGTSVEGRQAGTEGLIGPMNNLLVLRTHLSGNLSFRELLRRVKRVEERDFRHQDLPFERLVEKLQPQRSLSHAPLFQVMFELRNKLREALELSGLRLSLIETENIRIQTDLTLVVIQEANRLTASFEYNTSLFDAKTILRMGSHFQTLLEGAIANPESPLVSLPLLSDEERHQIAVAWNENRTDFPKNVCVHQLFEAQVHRTSSRVAVECGQQRLTYSELNRKANQMARCLIKHGVGPDVLVGICMERSIQMLVGLLGILKAGGAYVPLDPTYPRDRLSFMLDDSEAPVLLTQEHLLLGLPVHRGRVICLDATRDVLAGESGDNITCGVNAENLAYVIYTSGSTGRPKGVAIQHRSSVAFLYWAGTRFGSEELAGVLASTSICFDLSVFELFAPLSWGGKVILAENVLHLTSSLTVKDVRLINTVPSAMAEILTVRGLPDSVRTVNLAGEPLQNQLAQQIYRESKVQQVFNLYGPTEDTTYSTFSLVRRGTRKPVSIGRPIDNTSVFLLDSYLQPVPVGVVGELYVGGEGLARGYLHRQELTAERFIPSPFDGGGGTRLYRTGDLARYLPDGEIEFLGRRDRQVKLRGYRIELGEIEAVLATLPGIHESVVAILGDELSEKVLVAYVVAEPGHSLASRELRQALTQKLPDYMVPSAFVVLDELPLTPNGKVDRKALPPPDTISPTSGLATPRTPAEKTLAEIWCEVLRLKQVGIRDNFFELGGHSLLATRVMARAREAFQVEIPLRVLFEIPTIEALAAVIAGSAGAKLSARDESGLSLRSPLRPAPRTSDSSLPLSFAQQRLWFFDQLSPGSSAYNVPAVFRLNGLLRFAALLQSLTEIVRRHEALRTVFRAVNGSPVQLITPATEFPLRVVDLESTPSVERESRLRECVETELKQPFDLSVDCMLRACLLRLAQTDQVLVLTLHHIASDEWSLIILLEELAALYKAYSAGKRSPLPELAVQYADFALWQRLRLQGDVLESELSYWTGQLQGDLPITGLPADRTRTTLGTSRGACESILVPKHIADSLNALSQQEHATLFTTMLAAFGAALHRYTAETDLIIGSPIAGRHSLDTERLIGFFLNTLPLRVDLSGNPTFRELVRRLRPVVVQAVSHQDLPFERLVEELQPERTLSHSPIFQVMLNLLNLPDTELELEGLVVERLPSVELDARFDLTLYVRETPQGMQLDFVYATDLFEEATIHQFAGSMRALLSGIAANPDQRHSRLPILENTRPDPLANRSLVSPSSTFIPFRKEDIEVSIPARFEQQVMQRPSQIAVKTRQCQWTYAKLNREADRVRQALLAMRGPDQERIALLLEHDAPMVAAMLGVLKSGKTYVVLDPSYPRERLLHMLRDSEASAIVSSSRTRGLASQLSQNRLSIVDVDELADVPVDQGARTEIPADAVAYILYTSGSTGQPKGVVQKHRNVLHHIRNYTNNLKISAEDRLIVLSSYSFDAAVMDTYGALLNGATLCPFDLKEQSWTDLAMWMKSEDITIYHSTPTVYRYWSGALNDEEVFPKVRLVVLGGEEVLKRDIELHRRHFTRDCTFINGLGPTESTLALQYYVNFETRIARRSVPVGFPVEDTEIRLLNEDGEDAVVYGEIAIRSAYLATGYWKMPELTNKVFLPDPDGCDRRIYRTGDMGRLLPNGSLEFAGRRDFRVKLRGFRIELEEIETVLLLHPVVRQVALMIRETGSGERRLVAYIVAKQGQAAKVDGLRSFLKQKLPDYMVPSTFVFLDVLQLTPSGKVDRQALPEPDDSRPELVEGYVVPSTPIEKALAEIWVKLLGIEKVGIHDNFFELGGHSLLAMQMISQVRNFFRIELPVRSLFEAPTIADLETVVLNFLVERSQAEEVDQFLNELRDI